MNDIYLIDQCVVHLNERFSLGYARKNFDIKGFHLFLDIINKFLGNSKPYNILDMPLFIECYEWKLKSNKQYFYFSMKFEGFIHAVLNEILSKIHHVFTAHSE